MAIAIKLFDERPLCCDACGGVGVVQFHQQFARPRIVLATLQRQRPLPRGRQHLVGGEREHAGRVEQPRTVQPRVGENNGVELVVGQLPQPRVDVAADQLDAKIRTTRQQLGTTTQAACADARALRQPR